MSRLYETASAMPRLDACAPSGALSSVRSESSAATWGSAKHEHMHDRARFGVDEAMARLPTLLERWGLTEREAQIIHAQMMRFEWSPPDGSFGEVALALLDDGTVEKTIGGKGFYPELEPGGRLAGRAHFAGQTDIMWSEPASLDLSDPAHPRCPPGSTLWVGDLKAGAEVNVEAIDRNAQAIANSFLAARWTGATSVVPFILYLQPPEGIWDAPKVAWGPQQIEEAHARVLDILARRRVQVERHARGEPLFGYHEGAWCKFCPGRASCEVKVRMMKHVTELAGLRGAGLALTDAQYVWWAERISQADGFLKTIREALKTRVDDHGPIELTNGDLWGRKPDVKPQIGFNARVALPILAEQLGEEAAWDLVTLSKSAAETAVKDSVERGKGAAANRRVFAAIAQAGGLEEKAREEYGAFRPAKALAKKSG